MRKKLVDWTSNDYDDDDVDDDKKENTSIDREI